MLNCFQKIAEIVHPVIYPCSDVCTGPVFAEAGVEPVSVLWGRLSQRRRVTDSGWGAESRLRRRGQTAAARLFGQWRRLEPL